VQIVLNADDFGHSVDTVEATIECFERGWLTSATLMAGMPASEQALEFARDHPEHSFGVHLILVGDGVEAPIAPAGEVPGLVDRRGRFPSTNLVRARALLGALPQAELKRELAAQIEWVRDRGVPVSHVDSHRHLHKFGPVREALVRVLPRLGIPRVRNVQDLYVRRPVASPTSWLGGRWRRRLMERFVTTDHFYMPASAGDERWLDLLPQLEVLPAGETLEIGVHPGSHEEDWRVQERLGLAEFAEAAAARGHTFIRWDELQA